MANCRKPFAWSHVAVGVATFGLGVLLGCFIHSAVTDCKSRLATAETQRRPCPPGWIGYRMKCYYYSDKEETWSASQEFCSRFNASLAIIEKEELVFVHRYKGVLSHWIGLHRDPNQPWKWINGNISTWKVLGDGGDCAFLNDDGHASCSRCQSVHHWICSKPDEFTSPKMV